MPKKYTAIKSKMKKKGMPEQEAEKHAAMIFNSERKKGEKPVTRGIYKKKKKGKQ